MNAISNLSIYIPRMAAHHDEDSISNIMANCRIGTVSHIDFTPVNQKPGFGENIDEYMMSAFVHFSDPMIGSDGNYYYSSDFPIGNENFWNIILYSNEHYRLQVSSREYWICLENNNPVQRTMMNIHQVVENGRYLENLIEKQSKIIEVHSNTIENQYQTICELEYKVDGIQQALDQLIAGLFCKEKQTNILSQYDMILHGYSRSFYTDPDNADNYPTTRQGCKNESRIGYLEQQVKSIIIFGHPDPEVTIVSQDEDEDEDDISAITHSSMPELEDMDSFS
jgi:hypothetical protein